MTDLNNAKKQLNMGNYTCVLCKDETVHTSAQRGVKPLVTWLESGADFTGYSAADKVIGKATAFLYIMLGVRAVYAKVISASALRVLKAHNVLVSFESETENIINRQKNGICPFEAAVLDIDNTYEAYSAILAKLKELNI